MKYDAAVIGAGVAGLICGLKLAAAGKKTIVIEKQPVAGGFASGFVRKGFRFESSLHCVDGLSPGGEFRTLLEELGVDKRVEFIDLKNFSRIIYPEHDFIADFDCGNFKAYLKDKFPDQIKNIDGFFSAVEGFYRQFDRFCRSPLPLWSKLAITPLIYPAVAAVSNVSIGQMVDRYINDRRLKGIICDIWRFAGLPPSRLSAFYFLLIFRGYYCAPTVYIKGGFGALFKAIADMMKDKGAEIRFNTAVEKIITENKAVKAIVLDNREEIEVDTVISNANASDTLTEFPDDPQVREYYRRLFSSYENSISGFQVYLGLKTSARNLGMNEFMFSVNTDYSHEDNYNYCISEDYERCPLAIVDHSQLDPELAPQGKGVLSIMTFDSYANWSGLSGEDYKEKKNAAADKLIFRAVKYLPLLAGNIEMIEAATPLTMARYGVSPQGAIYGFAQTVEQSGLRRLSQQTKIKGLFLAGAWTQPGGGAHGCVVSGMDAAEAALRYIKNGKI